MKKFSLKNYWSKLTAKKSFRFWEIDFLRGIAIMLMIFFHILVDLEELFHYRFNLFSSNFWVGFQMMIATLFLLLVGISLVISADRSQELDHTGLHFTKYLKRGLRIFAWGLVITLITRIFLPDEYVVFGILHLIGASMILAYPFLRYTWLNLCLGILIIIIGIKIQYINFNFSYLIWLGCCPPEFTSADYFPILPWFGIVLLGIFSAKLLYPSGQRQFKLPDFSKFTPIKFLCYLGRYSLIIYLVHQPLIISVLYLIGLKKVGGF